MSFEDVFYTIYDDIIRNYFLFKSKRSKVHGIILMYHHVIDDSSLRLSSCVCTKDEFRYSLGQVIEHGYKIVSLEDALKMVQNGECSKFAAITFDDVPSDFYTNAYPILTEMSFPFTLFITTGYLDKEGYLNREQLSALVLDPLCTIGAHTLSHPMLRKSQNAETELSRSKTILEKLIGKEVKFLAYPYGKKSSVGKSVMRLAEKCGYTCAFGTVEAPVCEFSLSNKYYLPRVVFQRGKFAAKLCYSSFLKYASLELLKKANGLLRKL